MGKLIVAGDAVADHYRIILKKADDEAEPETSFHIDESTGWIYRKLPGGPAILMRKFGRPVDKLESNKGHSKWTRSYTRLAQYPKSAAEPEKSVWRVDEFGGYDTSADAIEEGATCRLETGWARDTVLFADGGTKFRGDMGEAFWRDALNISDGNTLIVHKLSQPFSETPLRNAIHARDEAQTLITCVTANELRRYGEVQLSRGRSWQRNLEELQGIFKDMNGLSPLAHLMKQNYEAKERDVLVIMYNCDAVACVSANGEIAMWAASTDAEGDFDRRHEGRMVALFSALTVEIIETLTEMPLPTKQLSFNEIANAGRNGLIATRLQIVNGFGVARNASAKGVSFYPAKQRPCLEADDEAHQIVPIIGQTAERLKKLAREYVIKGESVLEDLPKARFGKLLCVEKNEIESFRAIKGLMERYFDEPAPRRPLCLAVLGEPGAGKSYGIEQIIKSAFADRTEIVSLNLSQSRHLEVANFFHRARDISLSMKRPVCMIDEFDVDDFKHVAQFLAPMQDGTFSDSESVYRLGPCIFVFIGGMTASYDALIEAGKQNPTLKVTDFISRLAGYVAIKSLNTINDEWRPLRRAILLRGLLKKHYPQLLSHKDFLDASVIEAFLGDAKFTHGARSMETLLTMSEIGHRSKKLTRSALPSREQAALHVDPSFHESLGPSI